MAGPFATHTDLANTWRPLDPEEQTRADALLARASRKIRNRWPDVDARIALAAEEPRYLDPESVKDVVLEMVQTAMSVVMPGVTQQSTTTGPFSSSQTFANPAGRLYFTSEMVAVFEGFRRRKAFSIDLAPARQPDCY